MATDDAIGFTAAEDQALEAVQETVPAAAAGRVEPACRRDDFLQARVIVGVLSSTVKR